MMKFILCKGILPFLFLLVFLFLSEEAWPQDTLKRVDIHGVIRTKYEYNTMRDSARFEIRNARFQLSGEIGKYFEYEAEMDMLDEDEISWHDTWIRFKPNKKLHFTLGQMKTPYSKDYLRGPSRQFFSNRSFMAKQFSKNMRDIGFEANWKNDNIVPLTLIACVFNGSGTNNPRYVNKYKYIGRAEITPLKWLEIDGSYQFGSWISDVEKSIYYDIAMWSAGLIITHKQLVIETEYVNKLIKDTLNITSDAFLIQSYYDFELKNKAVRHVIPAIRFDFMNENNGKTDLYPGRMTYAVTLGFSKMTYADIRFSFEDYYYEPAEPDSYLFDNDKFTIELIARF